MRQNAGRNLEEAGGDDGAVEGGEEPVDGGGELRRRQGARQRREAHLPSEWSGPAEPSDPSES